VAHGRPGAFRIGGHWVDALALTENVDFLSDWQLETIGIWSCETGKNRDFIALLEETAGATIYSSSKAIKQKEWSLSKTPQDRIKFNRAISQ